MTSHGWVRRSARTAGPQPRQPGRGLDRREPGPVGGGRPVQAVVDHVGGREERHPSPADGAASRREGRGHADAGPDHVRPGRRARGQGAGQPELSVVQTVVVGHGYHVDAGVLEHVKQPRRGEEVVGLRRPDQAHPVVGEDRLGVDHGGIRAPQDRPRRSEPVRQHASRGVRGVHVAAEREVDRSSTAHHPAGRGDWPLRRPRRDLQRWARRPAHQRRRTERQRDHGQTGQDQTGPAARTERGHGGLPATYRIRSALDLGRRAEARTLAASPTPLREPGRCAHGLPALTPRLSRCAAPQRQQGQRGGGGAG